MARSSLYGGVASLRVAVLLVVLWGGAASADAFEFLAYTPPPSTWTKQVHTTGAVTYTTTANGGGLIMLIPSVTPIGTPTEEFETYWRANVEPIVKASIPTPQSRPARDLTMVWGSTRVTGNGQSVDVQVVMFVGRGSVLGTVTLTTSAQSVRDVAAFNASVKILDENRPIAKKPTPAPAPVRPALSPAPVPATPAAPSSALAFDYQVPPGYTKKLENNVHWLIPDKPARDGACMYGLYPPLASSGNLEKDVESAMQTVPQGWQAPGTKSFVMQQKGIGPTGWPYWYKSGSTRTIASGKDAGAGLVMAFGFWAPNKQVSFVYGFGGPDCVSHEVAFERLFHSIKVKGWTSDGGKAFKTALQAGWRFTVQSPQMMRDYAFYPSGRYRSGSGVTAQINWYEYTYAGVGDGAWALDGAMVTLTPDAKPQEKQSVHVRVVSEYIAAHWRDAIVVLETGAAGTHDTTYYKILDKAPPAGGKPSQ